jgi:archaemetzincin
VRTVTTLIFVAAGLISSCSDGNKLYTIGIQPIGAIEPVLIDSVANSLRKVYRCRTIRLPRQQMPMDAFVNVKTPRYRADKIIRLAKATMPDSLDYMIMLTNEDISTTVRDGFGRIEEPETKYEDWGVFGLGYSPGRTCVVSTFRLTKHVDKKKLIERLQKVSVHEIGHNLGLDHCTSSRCVMRDAAEKISTVDKESLGLCTACQRELED